MFFFPELFEPSGAGPRAPRRAWRGAASRGSQGAAWGVTRGGAALPRRARATDTAVSLEDRCGSGGGQVEDR